MSGSEKKQPKIGLRLIEMPQDAMSSDPNERMRLTADGGILVRGADGKVYAVTDEEPEE